MAQTWRQAKRYLFPKDRPEPVAIAPDRPGPTQISCPDCNRGRLFRTHEHTRFRLLILLTCRHCSFSQVEDTR